MNQTPTTDGRERDTSDGEPVVAVPVGDAESPPQQIATRLRVTSLRMWLALLGFFVLIVTGILWGVLGTAAEEVTGLGAFVPSGGLSEVVTPFDGTIEGVSVATDDPVVKGQVLVEVSDNEGRTVELVSAIDGEIASVAVRVGSYVTAGQVVAVVEPQGGELEAVLFVSAVEGRRISPGMRVYVEPSTAPASQYGTIVGTVSSVSNLTITKDQLDLTLGRNNTLTDALLARGPGLAVGVDLEPADTATGYRWTAGSGPDFEITGATLFEGSVVIDEGTRAAQIVGDS